MQPIYLDQAATSFPKAPNVAAEMTRYLTDVGANIGRGGYPPAVEATLAACSLRERLCELLGSPEPDACVLTPGATFGLNLVLQGSLRAGDRVLTSSLEHNSVTRPLRALGADVVAVPCEADGSVRARAFADALDGSVRMVCVTHASNVSGAILPVAQIGALCRARGVAFVVDAAQTAGSLPIDCAAMGVDALVVSGHKGLLGPQGIGAVLMTRAFAQALRPLVYGGTGSRSASDIQPLELPDKFESGTLNLPAIYGLAAAVDFVSARFDALHARAEALTARFLAGVRTLRGARVLGGDVPRVAVVSLDFPARDNAVIADRLAREHGVYTRCGLHCAPNAHRALGSFPQGAVRFSFGYGNTEAQIDAALAALRDVAREP